MQISPINQDNTNFKELHVSKQSLKAMGTSRRALLKNPMIKEASDLFEVLVKPSKNTTEISNDRNLGIKYVYIPSLIGASSCFGLMTYIGAVTFSTVLGTIGGGVLGFLIGPMFALRIRNGELVEKEGVLLYKKVSQILVQAGEKFENGKLIGMTSSIHELSSPKNNMPNIASELSRKMYETKMKTIDTDNLFISEKYLEMLENYTPTAEHFNKKINDKGDTLLTQFFDVVPDDGKTLYNKIIDILKNIKGLDYNRRDSGNISCLEKIMNAENKEVLPLVQDFEFNYAPELEYTFANIKNQNFKNKVQRLNIRFNDILEAVKLKSDDSLKKLENQLDSPLCDRKKLAKEIEKTLKDMKDPVYENWFKSIYTKYMNTGNVNLID